MESVVAWLNQPVPWSWMLLPLGIVIGTVSGAVLARAGRRGQR